MTRFVGLDVSQKLTAICIVDESGRRLWRGQCATDPAQIERAVRGHAGEEAHIGLETGPMTPWLVHELRGRGLNLTCLDARPNVLSSTRWRISGSACATTGCRTACSHHTTTSSTIAVTPGINSPTNPGKLCPSDCEIGRTGSDQRVLVLIGGGSNSVRVI